MSAADARTDEDESGSADGTDADPEVLAGELAVLREDNERLREEYARARQSQYRQSAATLLTVGVLAFVAGVVERFISASVGEAVYASLARNGSRMLAELGLEAEWVYVPVDGGESAEVGEGVGVRLFVPHHSDYEVPAGDELGDLFVVTEDGRRRRKLTADTKRTTGLSGSTRRIVTKSTQ